MSTPEGVKSGDTQAEQSPKYVEVAPKSGWQSMAKAVRETDEEKIRDTKEDIDTLLVFAGLFSAVLSAFLVESYQLLQPDGQVQMMSLLQTIATQNYTFSAGLLNVTSPAQAPPPFEVPTWALGVNGLWFASLIVSLATASFAMLVKSWLREYLAVDQLAPQLRLRVRQYRYPGLQKWKVFEIAAALPLLLQVALGLFFAGLCIFTAQIDSRMGLTSIPLVSGWAIFFILTAIAPLFSPRCPFKLLLLKGVLKWARKWTRPAALCVVRRLMGWGALILDLMCGTPIAFFFILTSRIWASLYVIPISKQTLQEEEDVAVAGSQDDTEILSLTDEMVLDDSLLSIMLDALQQSQPDPPAMIMFAIRLISNRTPLKDGNVLPSGHLSTVLDLAALSRQAYSIIMEMVAGTLRKEGEVLSSTSPDWMKDSVLLLLSSSSFPTPSCVHIALSACINDGDRESSAGKELGLYLRQSLKEQLSPHKLSVLLSPLCNAQRISDYGSLLQVYNALLQDIMPTEDTLLQTIQKHDGLLASASHDICTSLLSFLFTIIKEDTKSESNHLGSDECMYIAQNLAYDLGKIDEFAHIYGTWWDASNAFRSLGLAASLSPQTRIPDHKIFPIILCVFKVAPVPLYKAILISNIGVLSKYADGKLSKDDEWNALDITRICLLHIEIYKQWQAQISSEEVKLSKYNQISRVWKLLWYFMTGALQYYWRKKGWTQTVLHPTYENIYVLPLSHDEYLEKSREFAAECLAHIEDLRQAAPVGADSASVPFPEGLCESLKAFASPVPNPSSDPSTATSGQHEDTSAGDGCADANALSFEREFKSHLLQLMTFPLFEARSTSPADRERIIQRATAEFGLSLPAGAGEQLANEVRVEDATSMTSETVSV